MGMLNLRKLNRFGLGVVVAGLLVAGTPLVLHVCEGVLHVEGGKTAAMRCFWTARAEMMLGLTVVLTPLLIIPTCANPDMACNIGPRPAWLILGAVIFGLGMWGSRTPKLGLAEAEG